MKMHDLFRKQYQRKCEGRCPTCAAEIRTDEFRDDLSAREFQVSGMCQKCQDMVFGGE